MKGTSCVRRVRFGSFQRVIGSSSVFCNEWGAPTGADSARHQRCRSANAAQPTDVDFQRWAPQLVRGLVWQKPTGGGERCPGGDLHSLHAGHSCYRDGGLVAGHGQVLHGVPAGRQDSWLRRECIGCHAMAEFEKDLSRDLYLAEIGNLLFVWSNLLSIPVWFLRQVFWERSASLVVQRSTGTCFVQAL